MSGTQRPEPMTERGAVTELAAMLQTVLMRLSTYQLRDGDMRDGMETQAFADRCKAIAAEMRGK